MAPLEDDDLFHPSRDKLTKIQRGERVSYTDMSPEERRAAWAAVRRRHQKRAQGHRRAPLLWGGSSLTAFITGAVLMHYGSVMGTLFLWAGIALFAFALIAVGRNALGKLSGSKDDSAPPGF